MFSNQFNIISTEDLMFQHEDLFRSTFASMDQMRKNQVLCDVILKVDRRQFYVHKIVLGATIPYFRTMFTSDMKESRSEEVELQGIDPTALERLINFTYSGRIYLDDNNVQSIIIAASFLQFSKAENTCTNYILKRLNSKNAVGYYNLAKTLNINGLADAAFKCISNSFYEVSQFDEFLDMTVDKMKDLLKNDDLFVKSEEQVFESCMRWINHSDDRKDKLPELLRLVRLPLLSSSYLTERVGADDAIRNSIQCRDLLNEARTYHLAPEKRAAMQLTFQVKPRNEMNSIYVVGGSEETSQSLNTVEYFDHRTNNWYPAPSMATRREGLGVAAINTQIYAIGGRNLENYYLSSIEVYDLLSKEWTMISSMQCKRGYFITTVLSNTIYVCGGHDGQNSLNTVERYDPFTNTWSKLASMNKSRLFGAGVAYHGYIYALGGKSDDNSVVNSVERYDPSTNIWTEVTPMLTKRSHFGVAVLNGQLYACGGCDNNNREMKTVEMFDLNTNKWTYVASMNENRFGFCLAVSMGKLWAAGGHTGQVLTNSVEAYDPKLNTWTYSKPMLVPKCLAGIAVFE